MPTRFRSLLMAVTIASVIIAATGCSISPRRLVSGSGPGSAGNSEFNLSVTPTSQVITAGTTGTYTVSVQAVGGFSGTVSLSATASNSNVVASFNPPSVIGSGSSTLTITTSSSTPATTSTISVTGADSSSGQSSSVSVTAVIQGGISTQSGSSMSGTVPAECVNAAAGSGVQSTAFPSPHDTGFSATFRATPSRSPMDATIGFASRNPAGQSVLGDVVRFGPSGTIQVSDGDTFSAATRVRYSAGETYRFRLVEDLPAATFTVFVTPPGGTEILLGANLQVSPQQRGAASLIGWNVLVSAPESATLNVCGFALQ